MRTFLAILKWKLRRDKSDGNALGIGGNSRRRLFADVWIGSQTQQDLFTDSKMEFTRRRPFRINWATTTGSGAVRSCHYCVIYHAIGVCFLGTGSVRFTCQFSMALSQFGDAHKLEKRVSNFFLSFHSQKKKISLSFYSSMIFLGYFILIDKEWNSLLKEEEFLIYFKL